MFIKVPLLVLGYIGYAICHSVYTNDLGWPAALVGAPLALSAAWMFHRVLVVESYYASLPVEKSEPIEPYVPKHICCGCHKDPCIGCE